MITARLQAVTASEQRAAPRRLLNIGARSRAAAAEAREVGITALSSGGCRIAPAGSLRTGDQAWLKFSSLEAVGCSITGVEEDDAVCVFHRTLHREEVELIRPHLPAPGQTGSFGRRVVGDVGPEGRLVWLRRFLGAEAGATAIEYALVASLIAIAGLVAFQELGTQIRTTFESTGQALEEATD